ALARRRDHTRAHRRQAGRRPGVRGAERAPGRAARRAPAGAAERRGAATRPPLPDRRSRHARRARSRRARRAGPGAERRQARCTDARGRLHPPDRTEPALTTVAIAPKAESTSPLHAFLAVLHRDLYVTWKELPAFLAQVILQPFFLLFVFGKVLA